MNELFVETTQAWLSRQTIQVWSQIQSDPPKHNVPNIANSKSSQTSILIKKTRTKQIGSKPKTTRNVVHDRQKLHLVLFPSSAFAFAAGNCSCTTWMRFDTADSRALATTNSSVACNRRFLPGVGFNFALRCDCIYDRVFGFIVFAMTFRLRWLLPPHFTHSIINSLCSFHPATLKPQWQC